MILEDLGNLGDFVGGLAVIATLLYLSVQIQQNTQMVKFSIRQQLTTSTQTLVCKMIDLAELLAHAAGEEALTDAECTSSS